MRLKYEIKSCVDNGERDCSKSLGIQKMPAGYALMLDADEMFYFLLRSDGVESIKHWSKWAIYHAAIGDSKAVDLT